MDNCAKSGQLRKILQIIFAELFRFCVIVQILRNCPVCGQFRKIGYFNMSLSLEVRFLKYFYDNLGKIAYNKRFILLRTKSKNSL